MHAQNMTKPQVISQKHVGLLVLAIRVIHSISIHFKSINTKECILDYQFEPDGEYWLYLESLHARAAISTHKCGLHRQLTRF